MNRGTILLADDESTFAFATAELLRGQGYEVTTAASAEEAGRLLLEIEPDVLMTDLNMPGNDHLRFIEQVSAIRPEQQIIVATGYPTVKTAADAVRMCIAAYLVKPFDLGELYAHVARAVEQARLLRTLHQSHKRLADWTRDLDVTVKAIRHSAGKAKSAEDAFLMLSMGNVMGVLSDMKAVVDAHANGSGEEVARKKLGCPTPVSAVNAIRDTVETLVKTKDAFRSRELGELRKRLEAVLAGQETETRFSDTERLVS
ncbi:response regulator [Humisphaera borealis]|uniref:Response regulator n=1 Tax=Humisphaera borealis TaxID=2807512 RepID=A0A7M2WSG2_9BACT|nr:response regulator [Humisphaera borealis]QOV88122.1 response regulator [Humisphaera borealis]